MLVYACTHGGADFYIKVYNILVQCSNFLSQQEKHANALPYSTVLLPVSHGYTTETAIVLILTFSPVFSVSVPLLLDVSSCSVPSSSWFAGAGRGFCLSIYN